MPSSFEKYRSAIHSEVGLNLQNDNTAQPAAEAAKQEPEKKGKEQSLVQMTIKITDETKRKLEELKFIHRRDYRDLIVEAIEDLYNKLTIK